MSPRLWLASVLLPIISSARRPAPRHQRGWNQQAVTPLERVRVMFRLPCDVIIHKFPAVPHLNPD